MSLSEFSPTKKHLSSATLTPSTPSCALATKRHAYGHATDSGAAKPTTNRPATWQLTPRPQSHAHLLPHHPPRESLREWRNAAQKPTDGAYSRHTGYIFCNFVLIGSRFRENDGGKRCRCCAVRGFGDCNSIWVGDRSILRSEEHTSELQSRI